MSEFVRYELRDRVAHVTIDRPEKRNALNQRLCVDLAAALERADREKEALAIVLTGAGDKAFCAGADLASAKGGGFSAAYADLLRAFTRLGTPVVGRINGHALGGGVGLALSCDVSIMARGATIGTPEVRVGLFPMMVMSLLFRHVGRKRGFEMILTGERVGADEASDIGLVSAAADVAELDGAVDAMLGRILDKSPAAIRLGRRAFHHIQDMDFDAALTHLCGQLQVNLDTEDAAEGMAAFLEKRDPVWRGR